MTKGRSRENLWTGPFRSPVALSGADAERSGSGPDRSAPRGDGGWFGGDEPRALLLAHAAPDPVGLADGQCVLETGLHDRAAGTDGLGCGLAAGPGGATLTVGVEEEGRVLATTGAVQLPVPYLCDRRWEPANVGHLSPPRLG